MWSEILGVLFASSRLITPGLLILLLLSDGTLPSRIVLPAAFVLSPGVISVELIASALAGVSFTIFSWGAGTINLLAVLVFFLFRRPRTSLKIPIAWLVVASFIIAILVNAGTGEEFRREYSWHNMMQLAAIQSIYSLPLPPEDVNLAGTILHYPWVGWAQVATRANTW